MTQVENIEQPKGPALDFVWKTFVVGLVSVLILGFIAIVVPLIVGIDPAVVVTITTAVLTGLLGIFVPQPAK